jgi:LysM repeat protein
MPVKIRELDPKTGKPKKKMPLPKPKPRHANPKHPMNTERTGPLRKAKGGPMHPVPRPFAGTNVPQESMGSRPMQSEAAEVKRSKRRSIKGASTGMAAGGSMKIKSGDTLSQIAKSKGISLKSLLAANPSIKNANKIRVGQSIKIPGSEAGKAAKTSNPYKGMSRVQMADMDVKNKSKKRQRTATRSMQAQAKMGTGMTPTPSKAAATKEKKSGREEMLSKARKLRDSKKAANAQVEVGKGIPAMNKAASLSNVTSKENRRLDEYREKMKRKADRRMGGGTMKKKVMAYNKGGVMRGTGAATKGKGFSGCY